MPHSHTCTHIHTLDPLPLPPSRTIREQVESGAIPLGKFIITKQLTKRPEDYPDAKGQPHVMVATRRKAAGKRDGVGAVSGEGRGAGTGIWWMGGCEHVHEEAWVEG